MGRLDSADARHYRIFVGFPRRRAFNCDGAHAGIYLGVAFFSAGPKTPTMRAEPTPCGAIYALGGTYCMIR
jgi:hypothetical protein